MEIETRKSQRQVQSKRYNEFYTFSLARNNEFDQAINESLKAKPEDFDVPSMRTKKRIHYNNYFDDSDSENDDGDWRNGKKRLRKKKKRSLKKNKKFRQRKIKQKEQISEIEQLLKWRSLIEYQDQPLPLNCYTMHLEDSICDLNLDKYASQVQAMLITPQWRTPENPNGNFTLDDLSKIMFSKKLMKNGIVWLWSEKEYLHEIISIMAKKNFVYIENVNIIQLNAEKSAEYLNQEQREIIDNEMNKQIDQQKKLKEANTPNTNTNGNTSSEEQSTKEEGKQNNQPSKMNDNGVEEWADEIDLITEQLQTNFSVKALDVLDEKPKETCYFKQCRQIILMFRRFDKENKFLELRHQRTADVFFDMKISWKAREFVYNQIETLLPKAQLQINEEGDVDPNFSMLELWGDYRMPRLGWITICEKSGQNKDVVKKEEEKQKSKRGRKKKIDKIQKENQNQEEEQQKVQEQSKKTKKPQNKNKIEKVLKKKIKKSFKI